MIKSKFLIYSLLIFVGFAAFLYLDYINIMLYYDDAYTMSLVRKPFAAIYAITANDVHPPLYYWMLKIYSSIFGESIFVERSFSSIGLLAIMIFAATAIRKRFGDCVAMTFIVLLILFPVSQFLATEIRMYSWSMFFVLACGVFAYDIYTQSRKIDWIKFIAMALLAAYTHYYALATVAWIFVILFVSLFFKLKRQRKAFFIALVTFILLYSPWLVHFIYQILKVRHIFWVHPISIYDVYYHVYYFFSIKKEWLPISDGARNAIMYGSLIIVALLSILLVASFVKGYKAKNRTTMVSILASLAFFLPVITGFVLSFAFRPIIVPRYMTCAFGLLLLSLAIVIVQSWNTKKMKALAIGTLALLAIYGGIRYYASVRYYKIELKGYIEMHRFVNSDNNKPHVFLSEYFAAAALSRLNIFYPEDRYFILIHEGLHDNFLPFHFEKIHHNQRFEPEFILVRKRQDEGGDVANAFKLALEENYMVIDSLKALDMELYKMKAKIKIIEE